MLIFDYIFNLSIFTLLVIVPFVGGSITNYKPLKYSKFWLSLYGGIVAFVLVSISVHYQEYTYDLRYAPVLLMFSYFGPLAGMGTGIFALAARMVEGGNWLPAIVGWIMVMGSFTIVHYYIKRLSTMKKGIILFSILVICYITNIILFEILLDSPGFHISYLVFVMLGVFLGRLFLESYTKLYRVNLELSSMYKKVEESEAKYRLIAENTSDLIKIVQMENYEITYYSPSHTSVLGYDLSEIAKKRFCEIVHPDDRFTFTNTVKQMAVNNKTHSMEFRLKHKQGHWIDFESRCVPVKGDNGEVEHIVFISRDISERKKSEELLLQSEKLSIVGELAAGVAHEIRNPLTTVKGFIQMNTEETGLNTYNSLLLSELNRIESITTELLTLGKPQAVQMNETDLKQLIRYTIDIMSPQSLMSNIQFKLEVEEPGPFILLAEKNQMKQVLLNIFKNAIESMEQGGEITVSLRKQGVSECMVTIQDQGCGIPEELLPRLGEPFYSLKEKGTGLGIMICQKIIRQHHGDILYKSKVNEGTTVEMVLPLIVASSALAERNLA